MQSSMKNHRSSPIRPFLRTSARQALSFGLLAFHFARISLSFWRVNFAFGAGVVADEGWAGTGVGPATMGAGSKAGAATKPRLESQGPPRSTLPPAPTPLP